MCARSKIDSASASLAVPAPRSRSDLPAQRRDRLVPRADVAELRRAPDHVVDRGEEPLAGPAVEIAPERRPPCARPSPRAATDRAPGRAPPWPRSTRRSGPARVRTGLRGRLGVAHADARGSNRTTAGSGAASRARRRRRPRRRAGASAPDAPPRCPSWRGDCRTVVSGGVAKRASSMSSKPTTATSSGTRRPRVPQRLERAQRHPVVGRHDGVAAGPPPSNSFATASCPAENRKSPRMTRLSSGVRPRSRCPAR